MADGNPQLGYLGVTRSLSGRLWRERAADADLVRRRTPPERSQDYSNFVKRAKCGPAGEFSFTGLPDGAWYVITVARPQAPAAGPEMALMRRVTVKGGKPVKVRL